MAQSTRKRAIKRLPMLPAERALKVISGRWKAVILYYLFDGPHRLSALKALMPGITQKVLIEQLREMEEHGLVSREIFAEVTGARRIFRNAARPQPGADPFSALPMGSASRRRDERAGAPCRLHHQAEAGG